MASKEFTTANTKSFSQELGIQKTVAKDVDRPGVGDFYQSSTWTTHNAYYASHNSVKTIINKLGMWAVGKGYNADKETEKILDRIIGAGKDTFDEVINNSIRVRHIDGDSYAEIIGGKGKNLINLKPLNPGAVKVYRNAMGVLTHYGYTTTDGKEMRFEKEEIFHLTLNRTADGTRGTGDIESIKTFLDNIKQVDEDMAVMFHRFVVPFILWKVKTSDSDDLNDFATKQKDAFDTGKGMLVPDGKVADWEFVEPGKNGVDPLKWRQTWVEEVTKGGGVPALIMAIEAGTTEASSKMVYLAWQQVIEAEQRYIEKQIKLQLGLDVTFEFPARIEENLGEDEGKDGGVQGEKKSEIKPKVTSTK